MVDFRLELDDDEHRGAVVLIVRPDLDRIFEYRRNAIRELLAGP